MVEIPNAAIYTQPPFNSFTAKCREKGRLLLRPAYNRWNVPGNGMHSVC